MARRRNAAADKGDGNALALPLARDPSGQLLLGSPMRGAIKAAIALFLSGLAGRRRKRLNWAVLLGCVGIAIAIWILLVVRS